MDKLEEIEIRLWDYIDGRADAVERDAIAKLIAENTQWRMKYAELLDVHKSIAMMELEQPSMRFTKNVMEEIGRQQIAPATRKYINNKIVWGIGIFFILMLAGTMIYGFEQVNWSEGTENNAWEIGLDKVDYSKMFSDTLMNIFMMMNVVLGLFLLDRYPANKRKKLTEV